MNTRINYRYSNENGFIDREETVVVNGEVSLAQLTPYLEIDDEFIPGQVKLPELNGRDVENDRPWHGLVNLELTKVEPTIGLSAGEVLTNFKQAHEQGWDEMAFYEEIAARAAEECNRFVVQLPEELKNTAGFEVRMQSDEFGQESFKHFSLDIAFEKILELYTQALSLGDGIERVIGLVVNPQIQDESNDIVTIFRGHNNHQNFKVKRNDFIFACDKLAIGDPDNVTDAKEYVFSDVDNFDLIKSFLKQKELLIRQTETKGG